MLMPGNATNVIHVHHSRARADHYSDFTVAQPTQGGDTRRQFLVIFTAQDGIHSESLEARIPQASGFCGSGVNIGCGKSNFTGIVEDRFSQFGRPLEQLLLDHLHGDLDQLQGLLQAHRAQQLPRGDAKDI